MQRVFMLRNIAIVFFLALATTAVQADIVIYKDKNKVKVEGLKSRIEVDGKKIDITPENAAQYVEQSTGVIVNDGFASVGIKRTARAKGGKNIPRRDVVEIHYSHEPARLLGGLNSMDTGSWGPAIASFRSVLRDKEQRAVFRLQASFQIGMCYLYAGSYKNAINHFSKWSAKKSKHTPKVYELLGKLLTQRQDYKKAAEWYGKIKALEEITEEWKLRADLGVALIDLVRKKFPEAEAGAKAVVAKAGRDESLGNVLGAALTLQSRAIVGGQNADRLGEAQVLATRATGIKGANEATLAAAYAAVGDALYAQGKLLEARFPYLRVVYLYPSERDFVAHSLQNAGQVFIDLALREEAGSATRKDYLVKGMDLLARCATKHRGTVAAGKSAQVHRQHRAEYKAIKAESAGDGEDKKAG